MVGDVLVEGEYRSADHVAHLVYLVDDLLTDAGILYLIDLLAYLLKLRYGVVDILGQARRGDLDGLELLLDLVQKLKYLLLRGGAAVPGAYIVDRAVCRFLCNVQRIDARGELIVLEGQVVHHFQAPLHHLELRSGLADVAQLIADARDMRQVVVKAHQRIVERRQLCGQILEGLVHLGELRVDLLVREREVEVLDVLIYAVHRGVRRADAILARDKLRFKRVDIAYQRLDLGDHLVAHGLGVHTLDERLYLLDTRDCAVEYCGRVGDASLERFKLCFKVVEYLVYRFLEQRRAAPGADDA